MLEKPSAPGCVCPQGNYCPCQAETSLSPSVGAWGGTLGPMRGFETLLQLPSSSVPLPEGGAALPVTQSGNQLFIWVLPQPGHSMNCVTFCQVWHTLGGYSNASSSCWSWRSSFSLSWRKAFQEPRCLILGCRLPLPLL